MYVLPTMFAIESILIWLRNCLPQNHGQLDSFMIFPILCPTIALLRVFDKLNLARYLRFRLIFANYAKKVVKLI